MPLTHNQINRFWFKNPQYAEFKKHGFARQIFTSKDSEDFLKLGAYLIKDAEKHSKTHIPWREEKRHEILAHARLENAFLSLGSEYLFKGIFLHNGFSINKPLSTYTSRHPIKIRGNKTKLKNNEVQDLSYIVSHISKLIDFSDFDKSQKIEEKKVKSELKGKKITGITRMSIPYPDSKQMLDYIHFKRNYSLHRPFIIPEFTGITKQIFSFLEYVTQKGVAKRLDDFGKIELIISKK